MLEQLTTLPNIWEGSKIDPRNVANKLILIGPAILRCGFQKMESDRLTSIRPPVVSKSYSTLSIFATVLLTEMF